MAPLINVQGQNFRSFSLWENVSAGVWSCRSAAEHKGSHNFRAPEPFGLSPQLRADLVPGNPDSEFSKEPLQSPWPSLGGVLTQAEPERVCTPLPFEHHLLHKRREGEVSSSMEFPSRGIENLPHGFSVKAQNIPISYGIRMLYGYGPSVPLKCCWDDYLHGLIRPPMVQ